MPVSYRNADDNTYKILHSVMKDYHPELLELRVRVGLRFCTSEVNTDGMKTSIPVLCNGHPALACISLTSPKQRVFMDYDAVVDIDAEEYEKLTERQKHALLDHEMTHLVVSKDKEGQPKLTGDLRPALTLRKDDWVLTGFRSIVERYGKDAVELVSLFRVIESVEPVLPAQAEVSV